jgi:hypothetical protein
MLHGVNRHASAQRMRSRRATIAGFVDRDASEIAHTVQNPLARAGQR